MQAQWEKCNMRRPFWNSNLARACGAVAAFAAPSFFAAETEIEAIDNPNGAYSVAAGDTVTVTGPVVSTGDSVSDRFDKQGDGTLVLKGDNSFKRIGQSGGTLVFDGGATTVSGGTGTGVATTEANVDFRGSGSKTEFRGGATFTLSSDNRHVDFFSTETVISNATVDASEIKNELLHGFAARNTSGSILTIGEDGRLRVKTMRVHQQASSANRTKYGMRVVDGGVLEFVTGGTMRLDGAQYGFVHFDGGKVVGTANGMITLPGVVNTSSSVHVQWANSPITVGSKGMTIQNLSTNLSQITWVRPLETTDGDEGGALHIDGSGYVMVNSTNTFTGGVYLDSDDGVLFRPYYDSTFGAEPAAPQDNIFVCGGSTMMFAGNLAVSSNRNVRISADKTFNVIPQSGNTVVFNGEINGECSSGSTLPTTTVFRPGWQWIFEPSFCDKVATNAWKNGMVALDPGDGRTNMPGRIAVRGKLDIASGTTLASAPASGGTGANAPVWVYGTGNTADDGVCGVLAVSGGTLAIATNAAAKGRFFQVDGRGRVDVCGGRIETGGGEYLNALNSYGLTTIRDGGVIDCGDGKFRVAQTVGDNATVVRLATNGLLRCSQLSLDFNKRPVATFLFDGGYLQTTVDNSFCAQGLNTAWDGITFAVGPGGAGFDVPAGSNIWIYRTLVSGVAEGETDGGLMVRGPAGTAVCLMTAQSYNGPTTIDSNELQQRSGDDLLPAGTDIVLKNGGILALWTYGNSPRATAATLGGVSGSGTVRYATAATFAGMFAPSIGGTIRFQEAPKSLSGTLSIEGDATGCGNLKFDAAQDISTLSLSVADISQFDKDAPSGRYKIIDAPGGYAGSFCSESGLGEDWRVKYAADGVYLSHPKAFVLVVK